MKTLKDFLREYVSMGWHLFPIHSIGDDKRCSCGTKDCDNAGKHPRTSHGFKDATIDPIDLMEWLERWPSMNVGLATGAISNVVVLDLDEKEDYSGSTSLEVLEREHGKLPPTLTSTTGGGGKHYFFLYPDDVEKLPSSVGKIARGMDFRADGGYVVLPPSNHKSGSRYRWNNFGIHIAPLPEWIQKAALKKSPTLSIESLRKKAKEIPIGTRNPTLFFIASKLRGTRGLEEEELFDEVWKHNLEHCKPPLEESEVRALAKNVANRYPTNFEKAKANGDDANINGVGNYVWDDIDMSERGNAFRYYFENDDAMRYCYPKHRWFVWDGTRWEENHGGEPERRAHELIRSLKQDLAEMPNGDDKKRFARFVIESEKARSIVNLIKLSQSLMEIPLDSMDVDPLDINCLNGTLNLGEQKLRKHNPKDHITMLAPVAYNPKAECHEWIAHLNKIFEVDQTTINAFQRICGYCLTEKNQEQVMFVHWGGGKNGKSTTFAVLQHVMGDYAASANAESFMRRPSEGSSARNDLARLYRKRMVLTTEPAAGARLSETLIKSATGDDKIPARFLYQEFFEFVPQFKIFMGTNHRPVIKDSDEAIWRRLLLIPYEHVFSEEERRRDIIDILKKEAEGIFAWMVEGYYLYAAEDGTGGFKLSDGIKRATAEYRTDMDTFRQFILDRCLIGTDQTVTKKDLFATFLDWCDETGEEKATITKFGIMMHRQYASVHEHKIGSDRAWKGIGLQVKLPTNPVERMKRMGQMKIESHKGEDR